MKGTYCLIIDMKTSNEIKVGSLEEKLFKKGYYVYIGSAMNSLIPRIKRHLSHEKKIHWHIDYFLANENSNIKEIIFNIDEKRIECKLAKSISKNGEEIAKFGCSDCNCNSHLIYFNNYENCLNSVKNSYDDLNIQYNDLKYFKSLIE